MHTNIEEIANLIASGDIETQKEGILLFRDRQSKKSAFVERWASLHGTLLCLRKSVSDKSEPSDIAILERCTFETGYCENLFAIRLRYSNASDDPIEVAARNAEEFEAWFDALQNSSWQFHVEALRQLESSRSALRINEQRQRFSTLQRTSVASIGGSEKAYELFLECSNLPIAATQRGLFTNFVDSSASNWIASYCEVETLTPPAKAWTPVAQTELGNDGDANPAFRRAVFVPQSEVSATTRLRLRVWLVADHEATRAAEYGVAVFSLADLVKSASRTLKVSIMSVSTQEKLAASVHVSLLVSDESLLDIFTGTDSVAGGANLLQRAGRGDVQRRLQDQLSMLCNDVRITVFRFACAPLTSNHLPSSSASSLSSRSQMIDEVRHNPLVDAVSSQASNSVVSTGSPQLRRPPLPVSTPASRLRFIELLGESKLCVAVPLALFDRLIDAENTELEQMLAFHIPHAPDEEERIQLTKTVVCQLHNAVIAHHSAAVESLHNWVPSNGTFKPSSWKGDAAIEPLPTNLHLHRAFVTREIDTAPLASFVVPSVFDIVTVGAFAAHVQRFKSGGLWSLMDSDQLRCCRQTLPNFWLRAVLNNTDQSGPRQRNDNNELRALSTDSELDDEEVLISASNSRRKANSNNKKPPRPPPPVPKDTQQAQTNSSVRTESQASIQDESDTATEDDSCDEDPDKDETIRSGWNSRLPIDSSLDRLEFLSGRLVDRTLNVLKALISPCYAEGSGKGLHRRASYIERQTICSLRAARRCDVLISLGKLLLSLCEAVTRSLKRGHFVDELGASGTIVLSKLSVVRNVVTQQLIVERRARFAGTHSDEQQLNAETEDVCFHSTLEPFAGPSRIALTELRAQFISLVAYARLLHLSQNVDLHRTLRIRGDVVFSQALTALLTGITVRLNTCLLKFEASVSPVKGNTGSGSGLVDRSALSAAGAKFLNQLVAMNGSLLCQFEGLLSCFGDEKGMLEDHFAAIRLLSQVRIQLCSSDDPKWRNEKDDTVSKYVQLAASQLGGESLALSILPHLAGSRNRINVRLPIPDKLYRALPVEMQSSKFRIRPFCVLLNIGINEMHTVAEIKGRLGKGVLGEVALQNRINEHAIKRLKRFQAWYAACRSSEPDANATVKRSEEVLGQLIERVQYASSKSGKHVEVLQYGSELCRTLDGVRFTSCKSAKDRTAMSVTLEQTAYMMNRYGLDSSTMRNALDYLRANGLRLVNCLKNVGTNRYAFNRVQLLTFPDLYRPPDGTYGATDT